MCTYKTKVRVLQKEDSSRNLTNKLIFGHCFRKLLEKTCRLSHFAISFWNYAKNVPFILTFDLKKRHVEDTSKY